MFTEEKVACVFFKHYSVPCLSSGGFISLFSGPKSEWESNPSFAGLVWEHQVMTGEDSWGTKRLMKQKTNFRVNKIANARLLQAWRSPVSWKTCGNKTNGFVHWVLLQEVLQGAMFDKVGGQVPCAQGWTPSLLPSGEITFPWHILNAISKLKLKCGKVNLQFGDTVKSRRNNSQVCRRAEFLCVLLAGCTRCWLNYFNNWFKLMRLLYLSNISKATYHLCSIGSPRELKNFCNISNTNCVSNDI